MKNRMLVLVPALILLLVGSNVAYAASPQNLSLSLTGAVLSPGTQNYSTHGGHLVSGAILGNPVNPDNSVLSYDLTAVVTGLTVSGSASFELVTRLPHGGHVEVDGNAVIGDMVPAASFPLGCTVNVDCTGEIPALFEGLAAVTISSGGSQHSYQLGMAFESAYLNPFGGPILMSSSGGEVVIVATYSQASIHWSGVQMGGTVSGTLGAKQVSGSFGMGVNSFENLKAGTEIDQGSIAFLSMTPTFLDAAGSFAGFSTIPAGTPCPASLGFPPGTCTFTGLKSVGLFSQTTVGGGSIMGKYVTQWTAPAVASFSIVTASLRQ